MVINDKSIIKLGNTKLILRATLFRFMNSIYNLGQMFCLIYDNFSTLRLAAINFDLVTD